MKRENPAKVFLRQYTGAVARVNALQRAIDQAMERAFNISVTLKEVRVMSSPAEHDQMAANVCTAADASEILYQEKAKADALLRDILSAIDSVPDERQKAVLTMRYVNGDPFVKIAGNLFLSEPAVYIAHGRALVAVNKWLEVRNNVAVRQTV
jgi:DNA-directed RNA polymerase specialized sigma24 family protein